MKRVVVLIGAMALAVRAEELVIQSFDAAGSLTFDEVSSASGYRVEWAAPPGGGWTNFAAASARLDQIPHSGSGAVTVAVPMWYRVVATVTNPAGMALIPAGSFAMGNATNVFPAAEGQAVELPQHTVHVSAFFMDRHEVTKALWDAVKAYNGGNGYSYTNAGGGKATNHPVQTVNWYDAVKWCNARSEKDGLTPVYYVDAGFTTVFKTGQAEPYANWAANGYRLPTEAEWEKAARGGVAEHRFPWSDADTIQHARANYDSSATNAYDTSPTRGYHPAYTNGPEPYTSPVGSFAPNGYGLYDMSGNVWEWCWDWWQADYYAVSPGSDPRGPATGYVSSRVARGGAWSHPALYLRCARRGGSYLINAMNFVGFRCVRGL